MTTEILRTQNEGWGFFGTVAASFGYENATAAWALASGAIIEATGQNAGSVRAFLDSRHGRHFADAVVDTAHHAGPPAPAALQRGVDKATARWMNWTIGRRTSRETGIPAGVPYLTGFVYHAGAELAGGRK